MNTKTKTERQTWVKAKELLVALGTDGVSSDESDTDEATYQKILRPHHLLWRNERCEGTLIMIDNVKRQELGGDNRGSAPLPRLRNDDARALARLTGAGPCISSRPCPKGLPRPLLDETFLQANTDEYVKQVLGVKDGGFRF